MQDKDNKEVVVVDVNPIAGVNELTPKHFENLQLILHKMNEYQFRHVSTFNWKYYSLWYFISCLSNFSYYFYLIGYSFRDSMINLIIFNAVILFITGFFCLCSKSITRLYNYKHISVRVFQSSFLIYLVELVSPYVLILNRVHPYFEVIKSILELLTVLGLIYFIFYAFVPTKWIKKSTLAFLGLLFALVSSLMLVDSFSHYVLKDNELVIYSDLEKGIAKDMSSVDLMIDEVVGE